MALDSSLPLLLRIGKVLCVTDISRLFAAKARCPRIAALHHPALGQQHKALLGCRQFDDFQLYMVGLGSLGRLRPGVLLVGVDDFDRVSGDRSCSLAAVTCNAKR
jgi:hypothetical protein